MSHRDLNSLTEKLKVFMTTEPACIRAAQHLGKNVEIGIRIAEYVDAAFYKSGDGAVFEEREAFEPDVIFSITATGIDVLTSKTGYALGEFGIEVLKQYLAGEVKIKVVGSLFGIMKNGYLGIIKDAGVPFAKFIASHGVTSLSKIPEIIKKLREK
jgi:hypothetical protein